MLDRRVLSKIKKISKICDKIDSLQDKYFYLYNEIKSLPLFQDLSDLLFGKIFSNCTIKDGILYDSQGKELSRGECHNDDSMLYFVEEHNVDVGFNYGTMYVKVCCRNSFLAISYTFYYV